MDGTKMFLFFNRSLLDFVSSSGAEMYFKLSTEQLLNLTYKTL